ncbi:hypothetical protein [Bradyrhizobium sp. USDA 4350]
MRSLQTLTLAEVKTKAREFYAAGKLTAQHPDHTKRECTNDGGDGYRCAVAAAFNEPLLNAYPGGTIDSIEGMGRVTIDASELDAIVAIQYAHDTWAIRSRSGNESAPDAEQAFLALIQD